MEPWEEYVTVFSPFNEVIVKEKFTHWTFWILLTKGGGGGEAFHLFPTYLGPVIRF